MKATRFAPSPTGDDIHLGNLRVAVLNYNYARVNKGVFVLRIEDTKNDRVVDACRQRIIDTLDSFDMSPDIVVFQSEHKQMHLDMARKLVSSGVLYERDGAVWCPEGEASYADGVYGDIYGKTEPFVCIRSNGEPGFLFANIMDDLMLMEKYDLHVIRGNDHMANTLKQVWLCERMKRKAPSYESVPMIVGDDGKPLSKRDKAGTVGGLIDMGISRECIYEYLLGLGNGKSPAHVDIVKLMDMNRKMLCEEDYFEKFPLMKPYWNAIRMHVRCYDDVLKFSYLWEAPEYKGNAELFGSLVENLDCERPVDVWVGDRDRKRMYGMLREALCGVPYTLDLNLVVKMLPYKEVRKRLL